MRRTTGVILTVAVLAAGGALAWQKGWLPADLHVLQGLQGGQARAAQDARGTGSRAPQAVPVEVAPARAETVSADIRSIGTLQSDESVKVASEVAGRIAQIRFKEGQHVSAGDVLVELDTTLIAASQAEMVARLNLAKANFERASRLQQSGSGTARSLDEAQAELNTATALLNLQQAQLAKHTVIAPFEGVVGLRSVSAGAYVTPGTELVNLEKIDVLKVDFKVPEVFLRQVATGQSVEITADAIPGRAFEGVVYAIDPMVDVNGRSLSVRARLPNGDLALRPGLFVRVIAKGLESRDTVFVPESAIVPRGQERFVWRIIDGKAVETKVELGQRRAGAVELVTGVKPGEQVVIAGQARLRAGAAVEVVASPPPAQG